MRTGRWYHKYKILKTHVVGVWLVVGGRGGCQDKAFFLFGKAAGCCGWSMIKGRHTIKDEDKISTLFTLIEGDLH